MLIALIGSTAASTRRRHRRLIVDHLQIVGATRFVGNVLSTNLGGYRLRGLPVWLLMVLQVLAHW